MSDDLGAMSGLSFLPFWAFIGSINWIMNEQMEKDCPLNLIRTTALCLRVRTLYSSSVNDVVGV
jgi:hypothetical protein